MGQAGRSLTDRLTYSKFTADIRLHMQDKLNWPARATR
jgi:hypothetical protein